MDSFENELLDERRAIRAGLDSIEMSKANRDQFYNRKICELENELQKIKKVAAIVVILFALAWVFGEISGCLQREIEIRQKEAVIFGR